MLRLLLLLLGPVVVLAVPARAQPGYRDCAQCPELVPISAGSYMMGAAPGEEEREGVPPEHRGRSQPQRRVTIAYGFSLGKYEVTQAEFGAFVRATGHWTGSSCWTFRADGTYAEVQGLDWRNPGFPQTARDPVVCVNSDDVQAYVGWLKRTTGKNYRLPSEAEWEYAARAGSTSARYWGDSREGVCLYGNVADLTVASRYNFQRKSEYFFPCSDSHVHTAPVGQFRPNAFDLHDMLGNVWEMTGDCWSQDLSGTPLDGRYREAVHAGDCSKRVARGGSWASVLWYARAATRVTGTVGVRSSSHGFRVARGN